MASRTIWIVVADGGRAIIFEYRGADQALRETMRREAPPNPASREQGTDRPGRSFESVGGARHAIEPARDPHDAMEDAFAGDLARSLEAALEDHELALVLVAPPRFLGLLRHHLSARARSRVIGEVGKDLTRAPTQRVAAAVRDLVRIGTPRLELPGSALRRIE
jgi:protein required for attachment to host cells